MWIRFWHKGRCGSGLNEEESTYEWMDKDPGDTQLSELARENVPSWQTDSERGFYCGFERVSQPPEKVVAELIKRYEGTIEWSKRMLSILRSCQ